MANKDIQKIIKEHAKNGYAPNTLKNYLLKQGYSENDVNEALGQHNETSEKVDMPKHVNRFLTASLILFLIVIFLFGLYMLYFGK